MVEERKNKSIESAIMIGAVTFLIIFILCIVNVKNIILTGFNGIVIFKIITIISLVIEIVLNVISVFFYIAVMNNTAGVKFKVGNILFVISVCFWIITIILAQCA